MKFRIFFLIISLVILLTSSVYSLRHKQSTIFRTPSGWPEPVYDVNKNSVTQDGFILGKVLFYDPILSRDSTISCAHCHLQFTGFTHRDHSISHGIDNRQGFRSSPVIFNMAWSKTFMWDGGVNHLEVQPIAPIESHEEMDETMANVVAKLNRSTMYRKAFRKAFGEKEVTGQHLLKALTQFTLMLVSSNSKYDRIMRKEGGLSFSDEEQKGLVLFRKHCESCHREPLFTTFDFENNGLPVDTFLKDYGRIRITHNKKDSLFFKVPTLRNIEYSNPYMHDGRFQTLEEVLEHYTSGIQKSPNKGDKITRNIQLTKEEKKNLLRFLKTLSDEEFITNKKFSYYP